MEDKYMKWKIEFIVNQLLYQKNIIEKNYYEQTARKLDKLLFSENKK